MRVSRPAVSVTLMRASRSRSRSSARITGARRGCAARSMRWRAFLSVATSGCRLPDSSACCWARRMEESMSTTRFSSRERDMLCRSSSSCVRCSDSSAMRASMTEVRAALSRARSWASRARVRASTDWEPDCADWRANCSWILPRRCQSMPQAMSAATATAPTPRTRAEEPLRRSAAGLLWAEPAANAAAEAGGVRSCGVGRSCAASELMASILSTQPRPPEPADIA